MGVYNVTVSVNHTLDFTKESHRRQYESARTSWNAKQRDNDDWLPKLTSEGFLSRKTGYPTFGWVKPLHEALPEYDSMWVDEGGGSPSLAVYDKSKLKIVDKVTGWYHGSPNYELTVIKGKGAVFVTRDKADAAHYAAGKVFGTGVFKGEQVVEPTLIGVLVDNKIVTVLDSEGKTLLSVLKESEEEEYDEFWWVMYKTGAKASFGVINKKKFDRTKHIAVKGPYSSREQAKDDTGINYLHKLFRKRHANLFKGK